MYFNIFMFLLTKKHKPKTNKNTSKKLKKTQIKNPKFLFFKY